MICVFVIILNWNRADDTIECLKSVLKLKHLDFKPSIVVVDNGSDNESFNKLNNFLKDYKINLLKNETNLGYAGGNNVGINYSLKNGADYILILNNDTIVDSELLLYLVKSIKSERDVAIVTPKIKFHKGFEFHKKRYSKGDLGNVLWYAGGKMDWNNVFGVNRGVDEIDKGQYNEKELMDFATGTCMLLNAHFINKFGGFDEKYFMYFEDADLSQRLKRLGLKIIYQPKAVLWHKVAQSSKIGGELNDYFITRNRLLFGMRYSPIRTKVALFRESLRFLLKGRSWQKKGVLDFYLGRFGKGSWK